MRRRVIAAVVAIVACAAWGCSGSEPGGEEPEARSVAAEPAPSGVAVEAPFQGVKASKPSPAADPVMPSGPNPPADAAASDARPPASDATPPTTDDASGPTPTPAAPHVVTEALQASVETSVMLHDGKRLRVAVEEGIEQSVVWAQAISPPGPTVVLRKTSGAVDAIAAAFDGETLWVAWRSHLEGKKSMAALAGFDRDLRLTHAPRILRTFDHDGSPMQDTVLMEPRPGTGEGVTVAAMVGLAPCRGLFPEHGPTNCQRLQIDVIDPDGTTVRSAFRLLDGGDGGITDLVDVGRGVVSAFFVWHGGALIDVAFVPYAAAEPVRELSSCGYPPVDLAWSDGALLMVCPDPSGDDGACGGRASSPCGTLRRMTLEGTPLEPDVGHEVRFHRVMGTCKDGEPMLRLSWVKDRAQPAIAPGHLEVPDRALGLSRPKSSPSCPEPAGE